MNKQSESMAFPVELARASALEVTRLIRDFKENVDSGNPVYLRDGQPESYIGKLNLATVRRACRKWASEGVGNNAGTDASMDGLCKLYLEDIGQYPGEPSVNPPPFTGGQCPGVEYSISGTGEAVTDPCPGSPASPSTITLGVGGTLYGPISGPFFVGQSSASCGGNNVVTVEFEGFDAGGSPAKTVRTFSSGRSDVKIPTPTISGLTVTRIDGQPDDCGSLPPEIQPPTPRPDPGPPSPITIAPNFDVDIDVEFFPDGTFNIKFNFGGEGTDPEDDPVEVPVDPSPETREPGGEPGEPVTGTPGSEEEGAAGEGEELVGILVEIDGFPGSANILFTPAGPVYKGAYYAYVGVEGRLDLQPEGSLARQTQFYFAPPGSTHWRVSANAGYTTTITPYYKPINEA